MIQLFIIIYFFYVFGGDLEFYQVYIYKHTQMCSHNRAFHYR